MDLKSKFSLTTQSPRRGSESGLNLALLAQEVADARAAGSGAGVPDSDGTPTAGTIVPGQIVELNSSGNFQLATQRDLSAATPKLYCVVITGTKDLSGSYVGKINAVHGAQFVTDKVDSGSYSPGDALVVSGTTPGNLAKKGAFGDRIQVVGVVGPKGFDATKGTLDVVMLQGLQGY